MGGHYHGEELGLFSSMAHANALISDASRWFVDSIFLQQSFLLDLGNRSESLRPQTTKLLSLSSFDAMQALENVLEPHLRSSTSFNYCPQLIVVNNQRALFIFEAGIADTEFFKPTTCCMLWSSFLPPCLDDISSWFRSLWPSLNSWSRIILNSCFDNMCLKEFNKETNYARD